MYLYNDQFLEKHDYTKKVPSKKILIIASTGRSGSHMLGHALHSAGSFGYPLEYLSKGNLNEWKRRLNKSTLLDTLTEIKRRRTSSNGVFGIKLHYSHVRLLGGPSQLLKIFPDAYFVFLSREDILKQAVSLSIASKTGVWIEGQQAINHSPKYDFYHIDSCLREIIEDNASWKYFLSANACKHIEINFTDVKNNLENSILKISDFINVKVDKSKLLQEQVTKSQTSDINLKWMQQFQADFNGKPELFIKKINYIKIIKKDIKRIKSKFKRLYTRLT